MGLSLYDYCINNNQKVFLEQWDEKGNCGLSPQDVSYSSHKQIWWCCERGHKWQAEVKERTAGLGCPVCSNRVVLAGYNDLSTTNHLNGTQQKTAI